MPKVDRVDDVVLSAYDADDGTLDDQTACMTDGSTAEPLGCGSVINGASGMGSGDGARIEINVAPSTLAEFTLSVDLSTDGAGANPGDFAMLAYTDSNSVTTANKVVVSVDGTGQIDFVADAAFISQLADLGGLFAVRLVADLDGFGRAFKYEAEYSSVLNLMPVADPLLVRSYLQAYAVRPFDAESPPEFAGPGTWAGRFTARPRGTAFDEDLQILTDFGFRVVGYEHLAGETTVWVTCTQRLARDWIDDVERQRIQLQGVFVPFPTGDRIEVTEIKRWDYLKRFIY